MKLPKISNLTQYRLTHFYNDGCFRKNKPLEVVSKTLGHSSTKITQRYARTTEALISKNMEKIAHLY